MKQCSCSSNAWEGSDQGAPSIKEKHLALDSQHEEVGAQFLGATADKHHLGRADAQELSVSLPLYDIQCVCEVANMTKEGAVSMEEGLTLTSQGCRKSLVDQNVQRTKS